MNRIRKGLYLNLDGMNEDKLEDVESIFQRKTFVNLYLEMHQDNLIYI